MKGTEMKDLITRNREYIERVGKEYSDAVNEKTKKEREIAKRAMDEWVKRGGCKRCHGTKTICTWSTMDGSSWDEFGECPDCRKIKVDVGRSPFANSYHIGTGSRDLKDYWEVARNASPAELKPFDDAVAKTNVPYKELHDGINRGDFVIVTEGRKVKRGTCGKVVGVSERPHYISIGMVTEDGSVVWTYLHNVELLAVLDKDTKNVLEEKFEENRQKFIASRRVA